MKKIVGFFILIFTLTSCYDDYVKDYDYDAVYFTYPYNVRTFVVGEGMKFDFGVGLGGVIANNKNRDVEYVIDSTLITPAVLTTMKASAYAYIKSSMTPVTALSLLPASHYTLSNGSKFIIEKGQHVGRVTIRPDSAAFLADPKSLNPNYVLPLRITRADADSILHAKKTTIIGVKYENMLFGNYWHGGRTLKVSPTNVVDTIKYYTAIPSPESNVWVLKTVAPFELTINGYSNKTSTTKQELKITLSGNDVVVSSAPGATYTYLPDGESKFNRAKLLQDRKIFLKYKYSDAAGNTYFATDTLTFRNRIRDGVNEWQDENPANY